MNVQRLLQTADRISTWAGKAFAWLIVVLMLVVCVEVFKRYILNAPTAWIFDINNMLYGTLFMMCGAYTLAQDGHVRGDFLYGSMKPRTQATLDLVLYILFFLPGHRRAGLGGLRLRRRLLAHRRAFERDRRRPAGLPLQDRHSDRRRAGAAAGPRRDRALRRLPADRRMAGAPEGRRGDRRGRAAARRQHVRRRGVATTRSSRRKDIDEAARQRGMGGDTQL